MKHLIDAHCHIYPEKIAARAVEGIDTFYDGLPGGHLDGLSSTLLREGRAVGAEHFIVFSVATTPHQVQSINSFISDEVKKSGGAFTGLGTLHLDSEDVRGDLEHLTELGLKGVKLHPDIQGFNIDDPRAMRIYEMCEDKGLVIYVHTGDKRYDNSNPDRVVRILKAFPKLKFVGPHFGGWSVWKDALRLLPDYPNITVDTSSAFFWLDNDFAREIIRAYGSERVMYGTDFPMWTEEYELGRLTSLGLEEDELENIAWRTCAKLLDIKLGGGQ